MRNVLCLFLAACLLSNSPEVLSGYSVLTHEQLIDLTWKDLLQPLLLKRFPKATPAELQEAHAYAYGGCAIQDLGYYPFGNEFFSNLTHYVRTGDFIMNLLRDAQNVNEYAFALGALSHYVGDNIGHHDAINHATPIAFPKLKKKYGSVVTYDENPHAHVRTEFAFDIGELSKHRLAPGAYLRFIGLKVPRRLLAQSFEETYSLPLRGLLGPGRQSVRSYRFGVRSFLPRIAYAETVIHRKQFPPDDTGGPSQEFLDRIARADFQTVWNRYRRQPGIETHLVALLIRIVPKIGTLSDLAIKIPTPETQELYKKSINSTVDLYGGLLKRFEDNPQGVVPIPNRDLDTGEKNRPGAYALTDQTYAALLHKITNGAQPSVTSDLKQDILNFYSDPNAPITTKKNRKEWGRVQKDLATLRDMDGAPRASR
ncbi:MAG TPA: zinc dependent phospholipase C family protein [Bryobacteraceae bacterium]|nr:zinc dependent phospholipase C family protein [Bryobacteraceae bacterium]